MPTICQVLGVHGPCNKGAQPSEEGDSKMHLRYNLYVKWNSSVLGQQFPEFWQMYSVV